MSPLTELIGGAKVYGWGNLLAATPAFESIATATGTGSSGIINLSSIPSTYQHLQIRYIAKCDDTGVDFVQNMRMRFNGDTGSNYTTHVIRGDGSTVNTDFARDSYTYIDYLNSVPAAGGESANVVGAGIIDIHDYASTTKNKTVRSVYGENNNRTSANYIVMLHSGLWMSTSAITSITFTLQGNNFTTASQFALYGIKGA